MVKLFLDTEFNGHGGELISMALVSDDGREWYEVRRMISLPGGWVTEHVMPKLNKVPLSVSEFQRSFKIFLADFDGCEFVADWPADFEHLCDMLSEISANNGFSIPIECSFRLVRGDDTIVPENLHNALSDARALRDWWFRTHDHTV